MSIIHFSVINVCKGYSMSACQDRSINQRRLSEGYSFFIPSYFQQGNPIQRSSWLDVSKVAILLADRRQLGNYGAENYSPQQDVPLVLPATGVKDDR